MISGRLDFLPNTDTSIKVSDHGYFRDWGYYDRNGLLLLDGYVVNSATRRWDPLRCAISLRVRRFHLSLSLITSPRLDFGFLIRIRRKM
jgi:hypothetical protein